ncbi:MAG: primosomal protein N' [Chloroflexota bacterium]
MSYAEVAVNAPTAQSRTFSYSIPRGTSLAPGQAVWVPFGPRRLQGIVFELAEFPLVSETRDVIAPIGTEPILSPIQLQLARWIAEYYITPLFAAASLMLPPGFERRTVSLLSLTPRADNADLPPATPSQRAMLSLVRNRGRMSVSEIERALGSKKTAAFIIGQLFRQNMIAKTFDLEKPRVGPKTVPHVHLTLSLAKTREAAVRLRNRAPRQADVLERLAMSPQPVSYRDLMTELRCSPVVVTALSKAGLVTIEERPVLRDPMAHRSFTVTAPLRLTPSQEAAWQAIRSALTSSAVPSSGKHAERYSAIPPFLLHGITGSGKTELYLQAIAETVSLGKKGIVLVPEIALTPQAIDRFASRFPHRVAVLHSKLGLGEQFDEWQRIRQGDFDVVIGSRSAIFAPQPSLGLIVIDEEHEWSYKQQEQSPHYHTRHVALKLAELAGAVLILGSATPEVESYYRAKSGDYQLLQLPERAMPQSTKKRLPSSRKPRLPEVEVVDLRQELMAGNRSIFSRSLASAIEHALAAQEQVILFLNRRGTATFVQCRQCGHVMRCRRCNITLTYHSHEKGLLCHLCNSRTPTPDTCPNCWSHRIRFLGIGTQKVEEEAAKVFPQARLLRWDRDVTKGKYSHEEILRKFVAHEADILIGTQMIAKGLDLPLVTVVGAISADVNLHLPDFRSAERTFQLLTQVAGRAGRAELGGRVVIQTYTPEHYAIATAAKHDYAAFYEREICFRQEHGDPPFRHLVRLLFSHTSAAYCRREAERVYKQLKEERDSWGMADIDFIGPVPSYFERLRGRFRWQVIVRGNKPNEFLSRLRIPTGWTVDVDPASML